MTSHRLIRCDSARLLHHASRRHSSAVGVTTPDRLPRWRYAVPLADRSAVWSVRLPDGSVVGWCLEVEPGANGIIAHLSAAPVSGRLALLPDAVQRLALRPWTDRELAVLARAVEPTPTASR